VDKADLKRWTLRLLGEYSTAYGGNRFRVIRRFRAGWPSKTTAPTQSEGSAPRR